MRLQGSLFLLLFATLLVPFSSCNKEKHESIEYPDVGGYGPNVLSLADGAVLNNPDGYSMSAELGKDAELRVVLTNLSTNNAVWFWGDQNGWRVTDYENSTQEFNANQDDRIDLEMLFNNGPGSCRMEVFENGAQLTRVANFTW